MYLKKGVEIQPGLICRLLDEYDLPQINELISRNYSFQHPGRQIFKITKEDIGDCDVVAAKENIKHNASLGTFVKETGELITVEMNTIHDVTEGNSHYKGDVSERISANLRSVKVALGNVFADLNCSRYMYLGMACVKSEYRSRKILRSFGGVRVDLARMRGCEYLVSVVTSFYVQKGLKLGKKFKVLREVKFADYIDPKTGLKPDLQLSSIHTSHQMVYRKIQRVVEKKEFTKNKL